MQSLPDSIIDKILFPKYYKNYNTLSLNQKIYLALQFKNIHIITTELQTHITSFHQIKKYYIYDFINKDYYYIINKPIYYFILYNSLQKKNKSTQHLIHDTINFNYYIQNYTFNNDFIYNNNHYSNTLYNFNQIL